jgi:hypothetical protein
MVTELQIDANSGDFRGVTAAASLKLVGERFEPWRRCAGDIFRGDYVTDMCLGLQIGEAFCATSAARAVVGPALNDASRMRRCAVRSISRS